MVAKLSGKARAIIHDWPMQPTNIIQTLSSPQSLDKGHACITEGGIPWPNMGMILVGAIMVNVECEVEFSIGLKEGLDSSSCVVLVTNADKFLADDWRWWF